MKKITALICAILAAMLTLVSCSGLFGGGSQDGGNENPDNGIVGGGNGDNTNDAPDDGRNNPKSYNKLIYFNEDLDLFDVRTGIMNIIGPGVTINRYTDVDPSDGEVVFGESDRVITMKAKSELEKALANQSVYDCGYIIYVEGENIAVYWQMPDMAQIAIAKFIEVCIDEQQLATTDGIAAIEYYEKSDFDHEKSWLALEAVAGKEVTDALKKLNGFYDKKVVGWIANLYDPETGGFYYSISARDNEPFRPDLESTYQILAGIVTHGMIANYNVIPEEIKQKILEFVWSTQSPVDGYFYHPQWPQGRENLNTDRYGRDISWATNVIKSLDLDTDGDGILENQYPVYCAPNGDKCALHVGTSDTCSFPIATAYYTDLFKSGVTSSLCSDVSVAVSKVQSSFAAPTASVSMRPDYSSREAFSDWLEAYNATIKEDSGRAHNLSALRPEITAMGYADVVIEHLQRVQAEVFEEQLAAGETPTGLWQKNVDYNAVWGLLKYMPYFNVNTNDAWTSIDIKYIPYIIDTCVKVMQMPADGNYHMNDLYNMWNGLSALVSNVRVTNGADKAEAIFDIIRANAVALIDGTIEKMRPFKHDDGSFSYNSDGTTQPKVYGTLVSLGSFEGDVNAVHLCFNISRAIFICLGYDVIPIFTYDDGEELIDILLDSEPIDKNELSSGTITFENDNYRTMMSSAILSNIGKVEVTADPDDYSNRVLYFASGHIPSGNSDTVNFIPSGVGSSCYVFEAEMYILSNSEYNNECVYQITIGEGFMVALFRNDDTIKVTLDPNANRGSDEQLMGTFSTDEWHKLRFEVYPTSAEDDTAPATPKVKVWIDGEYMGESEKYIGADLGTDYKTGYTNVKFYALRNPETHIYLDNVFASREDKIYDPYDTTISDSRG